MATLPRFSRAEIRDFADWLIDNGWKYAGDDTNGHALFTYNGQQYSLPETPKYFPVQRNRQRVLHLMGHEVTGKRSPAAIRERQIKDAARRSQQQSKLDKEIAAFLGNAETEAGRAHQQVTEAAAELGCAPDVQSILRRQRELASIRSLMRR